MKYPKICLFITLFFPIIVFSCNNNHQEEFHVTEPEDPPKEIYSDAIFSMDEIPYEETGAEISARENRLLNRKSEFFNKFNNAYNNGTLTKWLSDYYKEYTSEVDAAEPYTVLILSLLKDNKYPALKPILVSILKDNIPKNIATFKSECQKDIQAGHNGKIRDLNTVHPARYIIESAYSLTLLNAYDDTSRELVEAFIRQEIEGQTSTYNGNYKTTGYNKEIFSTDVAFWVKMLYGDEKYPLTARTFESIWVNVTQTSYDADNSPHYDSGTGFYLILRWGLLLNRVDELRSSIHIKRIIDRMARTVLNSGQSSKFAKSMENIYTSNKELALDGGRELAWDLKIGYMLYNNPNYLYIGRKYEDLRFNSLNITRWKGSIYDIWPEGINFEGVNATPTPDFGFIHVTERITSNKHYNGLLLGRGDGDYKTVQDKIVISTGSHPNAPNIFLDLSYTQSKAATDHRIGITSFMFMGAHISTPLGRAGEPFRINRPMVAPVTLDKFPVFSVAQGDVTPSAAYTNLLGYKPEFDYIIDKYGASAISPQAVYCNISYSKFQYDGINASRQIILLHNGVSIVLDNLKNGSTASMNAATIYSIWPSIDREEERWILQSTHVPTTVSAPVYNEIPVLFYFPPTTTQSKMRIADDQMRSSYEKGRNKTLILQSENDFKPGDDIEMITIIAPIKNKDAVASFVSSIECESTNNGYLIYIPSPSGTAVKVFIGSNSKPMVDNISLN